MRCIVPCLDEQPALPFCRTSSPALVSPGRPCSRASSVPRPPTAPCAEWTAALGCFAPSLRSSPRSARDKQVRTLNFNTGICSEWDFLRSGTHFSKWKRVIGYLQFKGIGIFCHLFPPHFSNSSRPFFIGSGGKTLDEILKIVLLHFRLGT